MRATVLRCFLAAGAALACSAPATAQGHVGAVSHLDGPLIVERRFVPAPGGVGTVLVEGDALQTVDGRAEAVFLDGTILHLDAFTRVALHERGRFRLIDGRIFIRTSSISASGYLAETASARVRLMPRGIYGIMTTSRQHDALVRVVVGDARIESRWGAEAVPTNHVAFVSGPTGRPFVSPFVPALSDGFENWSATRTMVATMGPGSPVRTVEELERFGPAIDEYREPQGGGFVTGYYYSYYYPSGPYRDRFDGRHRPRWDDAPRRGDRDDNRRGRAERARKEREDEPQPAPAPRQAAPRATAPAAPVVPGAMKGVAVPRQ
jgi:hypothetical protein